MNSSSINKYEAYELDTDWNLTPSGPVQATKFITSRFAATALKCLYGSPDDPERPDNLSLPRNWDKPTKLLWTVGFSLRR